MEKFFKHRYFLISLQFITLFAFVLIIYGAIGVYTDEPVFAKILRNTNFSNLLVWSYWWPILIVSAILFGRLWCSVCPIELVTSFFGKIGLKKTPNSFIKSGWISTLFYATILIIGIHTLAIHRIPQYMAFYMLILFVVAVIVGLIWEKRTFCTYVCPVGHLLGLYSLLSFKGLSVKSKDVCNTCKTKDCISKPNHYKQIGRSCTSELYPATITNNKDCILCGQCFKSCTKDNITIKNKWLSADLYTNIKLSWAEIYFFIMLSSFVIYEILSEWKVTKEILLYVPKTLAQVFDLSPEYFGILKAVLLFIVMPSIFYLLFAILKKLSSKEGLKEIYTKLVLIILPLTASMHLFKALLKTTSRIPYWEYVFGDSKGIETANYIMTDKSYLHKDILVSLSPIISLLAVVLIIGGLLISFNLIKKQKEENNISKLISILAVLLYASMFFITIIAWRFL